jgi:hypothetical protein
MNKSIAFVLFSSFVLSSSFSKDLVIKEYCTYKQSAKSMTVNLPLVVKYKDGFVQNTQLFISCSYGVYCSGFATGGERFNTHVFDKLKVKHMGRDSVTLVDRDFDEFLLDIKSKKFRWTQGNSGMTTEHICNVILSE